MAASGKSIMRGGDSGAEFMRGDGGSELRRLSLDLGDADMRGDGGRDGGLTTSSAEPGTTSDDGGRAAGGRCGTATGAAGHACAVTEAAREAGLPGATGPDGMPPPRALGDGGSDGGLTKAVWARGDGTELPPADAETGRSSLRADAETAPRAHAAAARSAGQRLRAAAGRVAARAGCRWQPGSGRLPGRGGQWEAGPPRRPSAETGSLLQALGQMQRPVGQLHARAACSA
eukprot:CAMPEP_0114564154 /NCGR_PEP_ID=MMETSP0114-20121206/13541_1 /TAXON_ID=31324 /ORGANISM="Goniomonas sp, Strain m" /LENGTH=230 /DNA_ID=CAMNT_0001750147 /DNA_START=522 /DNA_END=1216 /DNA_ORIENTATION=+